MTDPYTPPVGNEVALNFEGAYEPPSGNEVTLNFTHTGGPVGDAQYVFPVGFTATGFGNQFVDSWWKYIRPGGFNAVRYGAHSFKLGQFFIKPYGLLETEFGNLLIEQHTRYLESRGWQSHRAGVGSSIINKNKWIDGITIGSQLRMGGSVPDPGEGPEDKLWVANLKRFVHAQSTAPRGGYGSPRVEHEVRPIANAGSGDGLRLGVQWISHSPRVVRTIGVWPPEPVHNHIVGGEREVQARGWDSQAFGTRIKPDDQRAYPEGFAGKSGEPSIWNRITHIRQEHGAPHTQFGDWEVWNLRQIAVPFFDEGKEYWATVSTKNAIENKNKVIGATGTRMDRLGYTDIRLGARVLKPSGLNGFSTAKWYEPMTMIAYSVRSLPLIGWDSFVMSRYHGMWNAAASIRPAGWDGQHHGVHAAWKPDRTLYQIGAGSQQSVGQAFIAYAIRGIKLERHHAIPLPYQSVPSVHLWTRYIDVTGFDALKVSNPGVREQRNIVKPTWGYDPLHWHGQPTVRNLTPEIGSWSFDAQRFGQGMIRTQSREVFAEGRRADLHGKPTIRDRRTWSAPLGIAPPLLMPGPVVRKFGGFPERQRAHPRGIPAPGGSMSPPYSGQVPVPVLNQWVIKPPGINGLRIDDRHDVWVGSIVIESGIFDHYIGEPEVALKNRVVSVSGINERDDVQSIPKVRVSPHTIYAVVDAPNQARTNHPGPTLHYIDHDPSRNTRLTGPGRPTAMLKHRAVRPSGVGPPQMHNHRAFNAKGFIRNEGWYSQKMGWHKTAPFTERADQFDSVDFATLGGHRVARPPYTGPQEIKASGLLSQSIPSNHWASNWVRSAPMTGHHSMQMGVSRPNDTPYMWQSLHVGPQEKPPMQGFDSMRINDRVWISHWVRKLQPAGHDSFVSEYDLTAFDGRMRVRRLEQPPPLAQGVVAAGFGGASCGQPSVRNRAHHILPDGNAEQYRKGAGIT